MKHGLYHYLNTIQLLLTILFVATPFYYDEMIYNQINVNNITDVNAECSGIPTVLSTWTFY